MPVARNPSQNAARNLPVPRGPKQPPQHASAPEPARRPPSAPPDTCSSRLRPRARVHRPPAERRRNCHLCQVSAETTQRGPAGHSTADDVGPPRTRAGPVCERFPRVRAFWSPRARGGWAWADGPGGGPFARGAPGRAESTPRRRAGPHLVALAAPPLARRRRPRALGPAHTHIHVRAPGVAQPYSRATSRPGPRAQAASPISCRCRRDEPQRGPEQVRATTSRTYFGGA